MTSISVFTPLYVIWNSLVAPTGFCKSGAVFLCFYVSVNFLFLLMCNIINSSQVMLIEEITSINEYTCHYLQRLFCWPLCLPWLGVFNKNVSRNSRVLYISILVWAIREQNLWGVVSLMSNHFQIEWPPWLSVLLVVGEWFLKSWGLGVSLLLTIPLF